MDCLGCEEKILGGSKIKSPILGNICRLFPSGILEQEYDTVYRAGSGVSKVVDSVFFARRIPQLLKIVGIKSNELLKLDIFNPKVVDQVCEDTLRPSATGRE